MKNLFCFVLFVTAANFAVAAGHAGDFGIQKIRTTTLENVNGVFEMIAVDPVGGVYNDVDSCGGTDTVNIAVIPITDTMLDQKLAMLLSAYMSEQVVSLYFDGCIATPWGVRPKIATVKLFRPAL